MAGEFSRVGAQYALDFVTGRALAYTATRPTYLALLTAAPTDTTTLSTMTEVTTTGYARQAVTWGAPTAADPTVTSNSAAITFGPFTANMASATTHCALVSSSSGTTGDFLMWWALDFSKQAALNESIQFAIAALSMSLS
jgi:hypothetical protein